MCFAVESEGSGECDVKGICRVVFLHFDKMFTRGNTEESMCIRAFDALSSPFIADVDLRS